MPKASLENFQAYLKAHAQPHPEAHARVHPVVTLSRETGAGGVAVANLVVSHFAGHAEPYAPWTVFDKNLVDRVLADHSLPQSVGEYLPEKPTPIFKDVFEGLLGTHPPGEDLLKAVNRTILRLAHTGNVVIVGRGGNFATAHLPQALHVRLVAPLEDRIARVKEAGHLTEAEAEKYVEETDRERSQYVSQNFGFRAEDPHHYHLTLNTALLGHEGAAEIICAAVLRIKRAHAA